MNLAAGHKVVDLGCGIGGATFPIADVVGPRGLAVGVDITSAMSRSRAQEGGESARLGFQGRRSDGHSFSG